MDVLGIALLMVVGYFGIVIVCTLISQHFYRKNFFKKYGHYPDDSFCISSDTIEKPKEEPPEEPVNETDRYDEVRDNPNFDRGGGY